jgi:hypothetical protein
MCFENASARGNPTKPEAHYADCFLFRGHFRFYIGLGGKLKCFFAGFPLWDFLEALLLFLGLEYVIKSLLPLLFDSRGGAFVDLNPDALLYLMVASMRELSILKRLELVDKELHSLMDELKPKSRKSLSLSELNECMEKDRISDEDSTNILRKMRDRNYSA